MTLVLWRIKVNVKHVHKVTQVEGWDGKEGYGLGDGIGLGISDGYGIGKQCESK